MLAQRGDYDYWFLKIADHKYEYIYFFHLGLRSFTMLPNSVPAGQKSWIPYLRCLPHLAGYGLHLTAQVMICVAVNYTIPNQHKGFFLFCREANVGHTNEMIPSFFYSHILYAIVTALACATHLQHRGARPAPSCWRKEKSVGCRLCFRGFRVGKCHGSGGGRVGWSRWERHSVCVCANGIGPF